MQSRINIYDVAREANVSTSTVSRVMNNKSVVARETRDKVEEAIQKLGFRPSSLARGLASNITPTAGILTVDIRQSHYAETAYAVERELFKIGYGSILCNTGGTLKSNIDYLHMLVDKGVSGVFCLGAVFQNTLDYASSISEFSNLPFLLVNCMLFGNNSHSVMVDQRLALKLCVDHLKEKGHRDILYVNDSADITAEIKNKGFLYAMNMAGLPVSAESLIPSPRSLESGAKIVDKIIESKIPFSAIIFGGDTTAIGGLNRLQELGYSVPNDVAVIGFYDTLLTRCCSPQLTTINNKSYAIGALSVKLFETVLEGNSTPSNISVAPELIVRGST